MRLYFSGGSPIPECNLDRPDIMPSYFVNVKKDGWPDARLRKLMNLRKRDKRVKTGRTGK